MNFTQFKYPFEGLTGSTDGRTLIYECPNVIEELLKLTADKEGTIAKEALLAIVNLSADENGAKVILEKVYRRKILQTFPLKFELNFAGTKHNSRMHKVYSGRKLSTGRCMGHGIE